MIIFSTNNKNTIDLSYRERNTETSLVFHGKDAFNFGQDIQNNFVNLLENFANTKAPTNPIKGQFFFNTDENLLYYYADTWVPINNIPNTDNLDIVHYKTPSVHSNVCLINELDNLMNKSGNLSPIKLRLFDSNITKDNQAVTKEYVDNTLKPDDTKYLPKDGVAQMTGPLLVKRANLNDNDLTLVNLEYVDRLGNLDSIGSSTQIGKITYKEFSYDTLKANESPYSYKITTYRTNGRYDDEDNLLNDDWFVVVWFNTAIRDTFNNCSITLPIHFVQNGLDLDFYKHDYVVVANSVDKNVPLRVVIDSDNKFTIFRNDKKDNLKISGCVMGYRKPELNNV